MKFGLHSCETVRTLLMFQGRLPGQLADVTGGREWRSATIKQRHFEVEGEWLKLYGRRGKTFKGRELLTAATRLAWSFDPHAPSGAIELSLPARSWFGACTAERVLVLVPAHAYSAPLALGLSSAVPEAAGSLTLIAFNPSRSAPLRLQAWLARNTTGPAAEVRLQLPPRSTAILRLPLTALSTLDDSI